MKRTEVDARGLECPQPVVLTVKALDKIKEGEIVVYVDSDVAKENVTRMAISKGCSVTVTEKGGNVSELQIIKGPSAGPASTGQVQPGQSVKGEVVYFFDTDFIGPNMELGKVLVNGFLSAIPSLPNQHGSIILISNGVRLATEGSYVLEPLTNLLAAGYKILICGTCLNYFKIRENVKVGAISNTLEILECLTNAAKIIKF